MAWVRRRLMQRALREWCGTAKKLRDGRRLAVLEKIMSELEEVQKKQKDALSRVHQNSAEWQLIRADRGQPGCVACAKNQSISRRCMSPCCDGVPTDCMENSSGGHAIVVGEHGVQFCLRCRGKDSEPHSPRPCGVLEPLTCTVLGAKRRVQECFDSEGYAMSLGFRPIPSGGDVMPACRGAGAAAGAGP